MPRNGSGIYSLPGTYEAVSGETIEAQQHNDPLEDLESDANDARPIVAGGTGATSAVGGHDAFSTKGSNVASASTCDIGAATGQYVHITGTTTITSFGTKAAGVVRRLTFDGALTLTHDGTSLILPGAANITTAAGDTALLVSEGSGNWRCVSYQRAATGLFLTERTAPATPANVGAVYTKDSGTQPELYFRSESSGTEVQLTNGGVNASGRVHLGTVLLSGSGSATVSFIGLSSSYDGYEVEIDGLSPATDGTTLRMRVSTDGGSNYQTTNYQYAIQQHTSGDTSANNGATSQAQIILTPGGHGNDTGENAGLTVRIFDPANAATTHAKLFRWSGSYINNSGALINVEGSGSWATTTAIDAIQFYFSSGNLLRGRFNLFGIRHP